MVLPGILFEIVDGGAINPVLVFEGKRGSGAYSLWRLLATVHLK